MVENINDSQNYFESIMDTIKSYNITGAQLMSEISRMRLIANELNVSTSQIEVDPQNSFPEKFRINQQINTGLERQTLSLNLEVVFLMLENF